MSSKNLFETALDALPPDDHSMRAWLSLIGCFTTIERSLRQRFSQEFGSSLPRYDVLTALSQYPDGLTMGQLAANLLVSKGNITGVVRRLQEKKYVRQFTSRADRRVQVVKLTEAGREHWSAMHSEYRAVVESLLSSLSARDADRLTQILTRTEERARAVLERGEGRS